MGRICKRHSPAFKAKVALQAARHDAAIAEVARQHQVHPVQLSPWKKQLLDGVDGLFAHGSSSRSVESKTRQGELYDQIGSAGSGGSWPGKKAGL